MGAEGSDGDKGHDSQEFYSLPAGWFHHLGFSSERQIEIIKEEERHTLLHPALRFYDILGIKESCY